MKANNSYDVFLSHNSQDKPIVRQVAQALKMYNLHVWLDEEQLTPGHIWQESLETIIQNTKTVAVLIGESGLGPWENPEMRACLSEFVNRNMPVIPVLLPGASAMPQLPLFLKSFTWVDLRNGITGEGLEKLMWGITGNKPEFYENYQKKINILIGRWIFQVQSYDGDSALRLQFLLNKEFEVLIYVERQSIIDSSVEFLRVNVFSGRKNTKLFIIQGDWSLGLESLTLYPKAYKKNRLSGQLEKFKNNSSLSSELSDLCKAFDKTFKLSSLSESTLILEADGKSMVFNREL